MGREARRTDGLQAIGFLTLDELLRDQLGKGGGHRHTAVSGCDVERREPGQRSHDRHAVTGHRSPFDRVVIDVGCFQRGEVPARLFKQRLRMLARWFVGHVILGSLPDQHPAVIHLAKVHRYPVGRIDISDPIEEGLDGSRDGEQAGARLHR
jgi:hypothetical protein